MHPPDFLEVFLALGLTDVFVVFTLLVITGGIVSRLFHEPSHELNSDMRAMRIIAINSHIDIALDNCEPENTQAQERSIFTACPSCGAPRQFAHCDYCQQNNR